MNGGPVPTFVAPRRDAHFSHRYGPFNKADSLDQFMNHNPNPPTEEVVVVIDPDNWLTASVAYVAAKVRPSQLRDAAEVGGGGRETPQHSTAHTHIVA